MRTGSSRRQEAPRPVIERLSPSSSHITAQRGRAREDAQALLPADRTAPAGLSNLMRSEAERWAK